MKTNLPLVIKNLKRVKYLPAIIFSIFFIVGNSGNVNSQVNMTASPTSYLQNFDGLNNNSPGNNVTWTDNTTIIGWYTNGQGNYRTYSPGDATPTNRIWSCGTAAGNTERSFGSMMTSTTLRTWGVQLKNTTGNTLSSIAIGFDAERWYTAGTGANLLVQYSLISTDINDAIASVNWVAVATIATPSNGLAYTLSSLNLANNATVTIRFIASYSGSSSNVSLWASDNFTAAWGALPLSLSSIQAYQKSNGIQLDWNVEQQINISNFEIERSANGTSFSKIGNVSAVTNGAAAIDYNFFDAAPLNVANYYRLKIVDRNGSAAFSKVVKVVLGKVNAAISVYPNPVTDNVISLELTNVAKGNYNVVLTDKLGQLVFQSVVKHNGGSATEAFTIKNAIQPGIYQLWIKGEDMVKVIQLVKE